VSSWAALKERVVAAAAERGHALAQVRRVFGRYAEAGAPGWAAPSRDELSEHFTEQFLGFVSPEALAQAMTSLAAMLRPSTGRTIAVLTNRLFPVLALNAELVRSAT